MSKEKFKRKIRRAAAAIAALALAVSFTFPAGTDIMGVRFGNAIVASAEETGTCGDGVTWTLDDAGKLTISYTGTGSDSGAMTDWGSYDVVPWYSSRESIKSVVIEQGVTSIGDYAFADLSILESVTIPDSVTSIGQMAFNGCTSLESIVIPEDVTSIGDWAFTRCSSLKSIFLPEGANVASDDIPDAAAKIIYNVDNDNEVTVTEIIKGSQTSVTIPDTIGGKPVKTVYIDEALTGLDVLCSAAKVRHYENENGGYIITNVTLGSGQTSFTIPDTIGVSAVASIENSAFSGCTSLETIFIPDGLNVSNAGIPASTAQIRYTVSYNSVTITQMSNVTDGQTFDIPETISGYPVVSVPSEYQKYVGNHTHYFSNNICGLCSGAEYVTGITVSPDTLSVTVGDPASQLTATVVPANAVDTSVEWTSSDTSVATVDGSGNVTAVGKGTATIKATAKDGSGIYGECEVTVNKATPSVTPPTASTAVDYGKTLADAGLTAGWTWENEDTVAQPANTYTAYKELTDDGIYDYNGLSGFTYDEENHKLSYEVPVTVNPVTPKITITAIPDSATTGRETTVTVTVTAKNPNNDTLTDVPTPAISYKIGDGTEQAITGGSFVIPANTPNGTVVTITATTAGTAQYNAKTETKTITVADCTHLNVPAVTVWETDETYHWHECPDCGEELDFEAHTEDSGTVTTEPTETTEGVKTFKCVTCNYVMRTEPIPPITPEHTHSYGTVWKSDSTSHWHECSCGDKSNIGQHISNGGIVTVQPTATSTGLRVYSCSVCGYVLRTETIPSTGYNYPIYPTYVPPLFITSSVFTTSPEVEATVNGSTVTLKWNKVDKAEKYYVYQYKDGKYVKVKTTSDTSATFKKLKNGETYKFLVRYTKSGRLSPTKYSGTISVKVYYKPIPKPTATKNSIKLTWEAVPGAEKYAVYKYVDGKVVKLTETKKLSVKIGKLIPDTEYKYIVRAYVDGKWTTMLKSDIVTVKTKAE